MADHVTFQLIGLQETLTAFRGWGEAVQNEARRALREELNYGVAEMRQRVPLGKTGNLLKGTARIDIDAAGVTGVIRSTAQHSHLVEGDARGGHRIVTRTGKDTGKRARRADPSFFMVPAMRARERFNERMRRILGKPIPGLDVTPEVRET